MRQRCTTLIVLMLLLSVSASAEAALKIGDKAPPLTVSDWVKGKPFDLAKDGAGKVVVLEFWATWCMPCIQMIPETNATYQKYKDKGLLMAALTDAGQGQTLQSVQAFVEQQGARMSYPVAFDRTEKTYTAYVMDSGGYGIPYAVVIDKAGKVAWFGHPGEPAMKAIVEDLLLDKYDAAKMAEKAALEAKLSQMMDEFTRVAMAGDWAGALAVTERVLALDPGNFEALRLTIAIHIEEIGQPEQLRTWVETYIKEHPDNSEGLAIVGSLMLAAGSVTDRHPDLAIRAADLALKASDASAVVYQAVADVYFQVGNLDKAVAIQKRAVEGANILEIDDAKAILKYYQTCQALQQGG